MKSGPLLGFFQSTRTSIDAQDHDGNMLCANRRPGYIAPGITPLLGLLAYRPGTIGDRAKEFSPTDPRYIDPLDLATSSTAPRALPRRAVYHSGTSTSARSSCAQAHAMLVDRQE